MENRNSMEYWYPMVKHLAGEIPMPKTKIILHKDPHDWLNILDGVRLPEADKKILFDTAKEIGYPLFMRSDLVSGKHNYKKTCYVSNKGQLLVHLYRIIEENYIRDQFMSSIVLRGYIKLASTFKAFNGLPIAPERRYFVKDGKVLCHHAYWVKNAIRFYSGTREPNDWERSLEMLNVEPGFEIALLTSYAEKLGSVLEGAWSLDFAEAANGGRYFIDCAEAKSSWHPDCKNKLTDNPKGA